MKSMVVLILTIGIVYGDFNINRNDQFVQFPRDPKVPVKLSINGYIEDIEDFDDEMTAIVTINTAKADSVQRCFCDIHDPKPIEQSTTIITQNKIDPHHFNYTLRYNFNSYLLQCLLSGVGIRCYIYNDHTLTPFQLIYNNTRTISYAEAIESKFEILNILNEAPHMIWLSSIIAIVILLLILLFPSFLWVYSACTCDRQ